MARKQRKVTTIELFRNDKNYSLIFPNDLYKMLKQESFIQEKPIRTIIIEALANHLDFELK